VSVVRTQDAAKKAKRRERLSGGMDEGRVSVVGCCVAATRRGDSGDAHTIINRKGRKKERGKERGGVMLYEIEENI
jgi:hypothetical protein